jgi:maltose alpha-D-glucosyltransferase/alpha-amylase
MTAKRRKAGMNWCVCGILGCLALGTTHSAAQVHPAAVVTGHYVKPNCPEWLHTAVFYQVYPQTFYDSDGDGIGDLKGIIQKLDYIKSLGVDGIWINPFFQSPFRDAGYDISDYYRVAPRYGTNEDARHLFEEAHRRGLKVIFDYVASYTSIDHPWFQESSRQEKNNYSNWYIWTNNVWLDPPKAYGDLFIKGYGRRNGQYMRNFFWSQPALNFGFVHPQEPWELPVDHPDVIAMREELKKVMRFWMDMGADGFRADMAGALVKNAHIGEADSSFTKRDDPTKQFWREIRQIMDAKYPEAFMVSEWSNPESSLDAGFHADFFHWFAGYNDLLQKESWRILNGFSEGHSFFDREGKGNIRNFLDRYLEQYARTKDKGYILLPLGNHDVSRLNIRRTEHELEMIFAFSFAMPGIPFIYYGNEIGMRQLEDLPCVEGAYKPRAGARTPMQWSSDKNRGFSTADSSKLYLPVDSSPDAPTVENQQRDPNSLLNYVRRLIQLRKNEPSLAGYAEFVPLLADSNTYPFIFVRAAGKDVVLAVFNPGEKAVSARFALNVAAKNMTLLAGDRLKISNHEENYAIEMPGLSYALYKLR